MIIIFWIGVFKVTYCVCVAQTNKYYTYLFPFQFFNSFFYEISALWPRSPVKGFSFQIIKYKREYSQRNIVYTFFWFPFVCCEKVTILKLSTVALFVEESRYCIAYSARIRLSFSLPDIRCARTRWPRIQNTLSLSLPKCLASKLPYLHSVSLDFLCFRSALSQYAAKW